MQTIYMICVHTVLLDGPTTYLTLDQAMQIAGIRHTQAYELARHFEHTGGPYGIPCVRLTSH